MVKLFVGPYHPIPYSVTVAPHRVILLIGSAGSDKKAVVNGIANYIMGVRWEDDVRLKVATSEENSITAYTFKHRKGSPIEFDLMVIDTPEFGDNEEQNKTFLNQVEQVLSDPSITTQLNAVGLVNHYNTITTVCFEFH